MRYIVLMHASACVCTHAWVGVCMLKTVFPDKSLQFINTLFIVVCVCVFRNKQEGERRKLPDSIPIMCWCQGVGHKHHLHDINQNEQGEVQIHDMLS